MIWFIFAAVLAFVLFYFYCKVRKVPKLGSLCLVTGGVKSGKSTLSVYLAIRSYKKEHFRWKVLNLLRRVFKFISVMEEPLLYSNVPLAGVPYVELTADLLLRSKRFNYRSTIYIQEASLVADSMMFRDQDINDRLLYFNKLIGHETRGGRIIYDTQSIQDCHFAIKRSLSSYLWIHHNVKVPFFVLIYVRELFYSEDSSSVNTFEEDVEKTLLLTIVPKSVWRKFDAYCYSKLTDELPVVTLKKKIKGISFRTKFSQRRQIKQALRTDKILTLRRRSR